jgi:hypothetical protein
MLPAIKFDNQALLDTTEIRKVRTNTLLPAEFEAPKALSPEPVS